jgi:5-methylcytosine-specific restriction endonuclease McrA
MPSKLKTCGLPGRSIKQSLATAPKTEWRSFYASKAWKVFRRDYLARVGYTCKACERMAFRPHIDHVVPLADGGDPWDDGNLQVLCGSCHGRKTAEEQRAKYPDRQRV